MKRILSITLVLTLLAVPACALSPPQIGGLFPSALASEDPGTAAEQGPACPPAPEEDPDSLPAEPAGDAAAVSGTLSVVLLTAAGILALFDLVLILTGISRIQVPIYALYPDGTRTWIQTATVNRNSPCLVIDYLLAPAARQFLVVLRPGLAAKLKGRTLTIRIGRRLVCHTVSCACEVLADAG